MEKKNQIDLTHGKKKKRKKGREYNKCRAKEREANLVGKLRCQEV